VDNFRDGGGPDADNEYTGGSGHAPPENDDDDLNGIPV
jgi:hypothetical protein